MLLIVVNPETIVFHDMLHFIYSDISCHITRVLLYKHYHTERRQQTLELLVNENFIHFTQSKMNWSETSHLGSGADAAKEFLYDRMWGHSTVQSAPTPLTTSP